MILIREALQQWHPLQDAAEILSAFHSLWSLSLGEQPTRYLHLATWCVLYILGPVRGARERRIGIMHFSSKCIAILNPSSMAFQS